MVAMMIPAVMAVMMGFVMRLVTMPRFAVVKLGGMMMEVDVTGDCRPLRRRLLSVKVTVFVFVMMLVAVVMEMLVLMMVVDLGGSARHHQEGVLSNDIVLQDEYLA